MPGERAGAGASAGAGEGPGQGRGLLEARGVVKRFGGLAAVDGMDIDIREGELLGLIGPNGAGKTTLFNVIAGFHRPDAGRITFDGEDITGLRPHIIARHGIARTFQIVRPLARLTVLENVMLAGTQQRGERMLPALLTPGAVRRDEEAVAERARGQIRFFGLEALADELAGNLSGGQKKLLELARCFMLEPRLVLLDEPMAGVNPTLAREIMGLIRRAREERGATFLMVEHDIETVMENCGRVIVMAQGRKLVEGEPHDVRADPRVVEAYLGY